MPPTSPLPPNILALYAWVLSHLGLIAWDIGSVVTCASFVLVGLEGITRFLMHFFPKAVKADTWLRRAIEKLHYVRDHFVLAIMAMAPNKAQLPPLPSEPTMTPDGPQVDVPLKPKAPGGFAALEMMLTTLLLFAFAAVVSLGCGWWRSTSPANQAAIVDCLTVAGSDAYRDAKKAIASGHAPDGGEWRAYVEALGVDVGVCAARHLLAGEGASQPAATVDAAATDRAKAFLDAHADVRAEN